MDNHPSPSAEVRRARARIAVLGVHPTAGRLRASFRLAGMAAVAVDIAPVAVPDNA